MLEGAFSFRGRIGRLNYFLACLIMGPAVVVALVFLFVLMAAATKSMASMFFFGFLFLLLVGAMLWYSFSLQARRFRDIGWDPATMIIGWIMVDIADLVLAKLVPSMAIGPQHTGTALGALVNLGLSLSLLFWPSGSHSGADIGSVFGDDDPEPQTSRLDALGLGAAGRFEAPALATVPARVALRPGAPKQFGRRGLR